MLVPTGKVYLKSLSQMENGYVKAISVLAFYNDACLMCLDGESSVSMQSI
jgi:hypothetical protein